MKVTTEKKLRSFVYAQLVNNKSTSRVKVSEDYIYVYIPEVKLILRRNQQTVDMTMWSCMLLKHIVKCANVCFLIHIQIAV